jgi:class 3 adenylate cyclase
MAASSRAKMYFRRIYRDCRAIETRRAETAVNFLRLFAVGVLYGNTLVNYFIRHVIPGGMFIGFSVVSALWLAVFFITRVYLRKRTAVRPWFPFVSVTVDTLLLTVCLFIMENPASHLTAVYYLIIAVTTLRFHAGVAAFSGVISVVSYLLVLAFHTGAAPLPNATDSVITVLTMLILSAVAAVAANRGRTLIYTVAKSLVDYTKARNALVRYVSNSVADEILKMDDRSLLEGKRRDVTILMSDLRGFTRLSDSLSPETVVEILNAYFATMIEVVFKNGGTLDKFMGDAIMVIFGAPVDTVDHAARAVRTAVEMQENMSRINEKLQRHGLPEIRMGIGLSAGPAVVGDIGSEVRSEYTAIGHTVNLAQRLESIAGAGEILATESVIQNLNGDFIGDPIEPLTLAGIAKEIRAWRIRKAP